VLPGGGKRGCSGLHAFAAEHRKNVYLSNSLKQLDNDAAPRPEATAKFASWSSANGPEAVTRSQERSALSSTGQGTN
jgi:hypothetical protein